MTNKWIHPQEPIRKAVNFDFARYALDLGAPAAGTDRDDTLCSVEHSAGDWTLYMIRQLPDFFPAFNQLADIREIRVQVGYGEAQDEQLLTTINQSPPAFFAWGGRNRAQMLHYHGETVQVRVKWRVPTGTPAETDRLVTWVSPSRPARYEVPFIATQEQLVLPPPFTVVNPPVRVPIWATTMTVASNCTDFNTGAIAVPPPVWAAFFDFADTPFSLGPTVLCVPGADVPIPTDTRFVRFVRPVAVAGITDFVTGTFNCRS